MNKFRKKPVVIEAIQWDGTNLKQLVSWGAPATLLPSSGGASLIIGTLEDGPNNEAIFAFHAANNPVMECCDMHCACKPDIFAAAYDSVEN
jgi:hypothetical protein